MRKTIVKLLLGILIGLIAFSQNAIALAPVSSNSIEGLFPENMRASAPFSGIFTDETILTLQQISPAQALHALDVLRGSNGDLMLDRAPNRMEGATMLVRLLGVEQEALSQKYNHTFTDVAPWADPYVGYLYQHGLTRGIGNQRYGSEISMDEKSYLTFLLRSLGYTDLNGEDFTWGTVEQKAMQVGLLRPDETLSVLFTRNRLAELSWRSMFLTHKHHNQYLITFLHEQGLISTGRVDTLLKQENSRLLDQWLVYLPQVEKAFLDHQERITLNLNKTLATSELQKHLAALLERVQILTGVFYRGYSTELWQNGASYTLHINPRYVNTRAQGRKLSQMADQILELVVKPEMTEFEIVKAVHDFIVNTLQYDTTMPIDKIPESSFHALGALETRKAVCNGYSELMVILLNRVGIPCRMVIGVAGGVNHAWNMVLINGETYHIDVTWNDPVTNGQGGILRYDYFNLNDEHLRISHTWEAKDYPPCVATSENYFIKNNLVMNTETDFINTVKDRLRNRNTTFALKLPFIENLQELNIEKIMNDISADIGYTFSRYRFALNEDLRIVRFDFIDYVN